MLDILNYLMTTAPNWGDKSNRMGLVGLPINAILDWPMGTASGFALFLDPEVNAMMKKILNAWGQFLKSPASAYVLSHHVDCWFGAVGTRELIATASIGEVAGRNLQFDDLFICDSSKKHYGFKSWDDFFTRQFREGIRPVASPNDDAVIANACESKTYHVQYNVAARDKFWVKGQPYSIIDMFDHSPCAEEFIGGTVYQAFLSALSYHRWHAPVSGTIVNAWVIDGTYYSEPLFQGLANPDARNPSIDVDGTVTSQEYITAVATRAIILIEADNKDIGVMAFMAVGMSEVSTCSIGVVVGERIIKGQEIGMFHFGGSTHCLLFRKGVNVSGFPQPGGRGNVPVLSQVAVVKATKMHQVG
jgi:phosphatidylserine decarboxylase